ncbi:unnamed protein product [Lupinus luteus]|uniref:Uncharacterized protein n=1 Tax=Lupinus luteus TaxID=3873 RepID=A0AAV1XT39_LUPLU
MASKEQNRSYPESYPKFYPNSYLKSYPKSDPKTYPKTYHVVIFLQRSSSQPQSLENRSKTWKSLPINPSGGCVIFASDGGRPRSGTVFVGGFVLGGLITGALGCIYAPQFSKAIAAADGKELMRKLPKFIYDEEKALESYPILFESYPTLS